MGEFAQANSASQNESNHLRTVIEEINRRPRRVYEICELCLEHNIKRRGIYDFLSISTAFGICKKVSSDKFEWIGLNNFESMIQQVARFVEVEAKVRTIGEMFNCSINSSLQNMALCVVKLFLYLGVKFLDLRQVGKLFSGGVAKYKTMLRKLYTIVSCLEIAGIVSRTNTAAEIKFNFTTLLNQPKTSISMQSLLNTEEELETESVYERRRKEFENFSEPKVSMHTRDIIPKNNGFYPMMLLKNDVRYSIPIQ